ncbi:MAG: hypothetical protein VYC39_04605 [Myxococcota bacterium]|nr:hypothetical protein [Myxococcota bacterium]
MLAKIVILTLFVAQSEIPLEGTQPGDLLIPPEPSSRCGCHFDFEENVRSEPGQSYSATAMALSALDPLFQAALDVAHKDSPGLSPTCLRCHAPAGWLAGRSQPGDGSSLEAEDFEGVTCDVCHRMVKPDTGTTHIGDGQYTISDSPDKRGSRGTPPVTGHGTRRSEYVKSSETCGVCHSLFNPLERAHDAQGNDLGFEFYEQRTYEEWRDSKFVNEKSCIDCHMARVEGYSCREKLNKYDDLAHHSIIGGNYFVGKAVALLYPNMDLSAQAEHTKQLVRQKLKTAAKLEIVESSNPAYVPVVESGDEFPITIRLTNLTGHKLPTGYPEGRRVFLQVSLKLEGSSPIIVSGHWDRESGDIVPDEQLRTYETTHGKVGEGRTQHLALANQILTDTRIPPEGFRPSEPDMVPVGRDYGEAPYRHYDEYTYQVPIPGGIRETLTASIAITAFHQVTSGEYVNFLLESLGEDNVRARKLKTAYLALGKVPPEPIASVVQAIEVIKRAPVTVDASVSADSGAAEFTPIDEDELSGNCSCRTAAFTIDEEHSSYAWLGLFVFLLFFRYRRR